MNKQVIIILGPPGSGKGTQAKILAGKLSIPHISTGDLFRLAIASKTELGKKIEEIYNSGDLIPDELTFSLLKERVSSIDCARGFILDGYPRTIKQAQILDKEAETGKMAIAVVVAIEVSNKECIKRLVNRRHDPQTGKIYNLYTSPKPTSDIEPRLVQREDDKEKAIKKRLSKYHEQTEPLLKYYGNRAAKINGEQSIEKITEDIIKALA